MNDLTIYSILLGAVLLGLVGVTYLSRKGILNISSIFTMKKILYITQCVLDGLKLDKETRDKSKVFLDVADSAIDYVNEILQSETTETKRVAALKVVEKTLKELGIIPTPSEQKLIEIVIDEGINFIDRYPMK